MEPVNLFDLAAQQARWLAVRQATVAGNVANANTPGYLAADVEPFDKVLDRTGVTLASTQASHVGAAGSSSGDAGSFGVRQPDGFAVRTGEDKVVLEQELMKTGEIRRAFELNTAVVKAFHRMIMLSTRS